MVKTKNTTHQSSLLFCLLNIFVWLSFTCHTNLEAVLVFLDGTSSVGKSSICTQIRTYEQWGVVASLYWDWGQQNLKALFSAEFSKIQKALSSDNIIHALRRNIIVFNEKATKCQKEEALQSIKNIQLVLDSSTDTELNDWHMKEFRSFSSNVLQDQLVRNEHVLFDGSWYTDLDGLHIKDKIYSILVYCPFSEMIYRIIKRRKEAFDSRNVINHRFFREGLKGFMRLYDLTSECDGAIDMITQKEIEEVIELVESMYDPSKVSGKTRFVVREFSFEQFEEYCKNLLAKFEGHEKLYVVPKKQYDLIIRSDLTSPIECAKRIIDFVS